MYVCTNMYRTYSMHTIRPTVRSTVTITTVIVIDCQTLLLYVGIVKELCYRVPTTLVTGARAIPYLIVKQALVYC